MAQMTMRVALHRLGRLLQTLASHVEQPTVKRSAQAAVLQTAEAQICAAMRASLIHEPEASARVPKQHQLLAEQSHRKDRARRMELR